MSHGDGIKMRPERENTTQKLLLVSPAWITIATVPQQRKGPKEFCPG
jgi:hypothetical protein